MLRGFPIAFMHFPLNKTSISITAETCGGSQAGLNKRSAFNLKNVMDFRQNREGSQALKSPVDQTSNKNWT